MFFHVSSEFHENLGAVALSCPGPRIQRETRGRSRQSMGNEA